MEVIATDCLVIGAGLAGSAYALHAAQAGFRVELLSLGAPLESNSDWAQGGIIYDPAADPHPLAQDIMEASDHTSNPAAVEQMVREGPGALKELLLDDLRVDFDRDAAGELELAREGGHGVRRIIHAKDRTGHAILTAVAGRVDASPGLTRRSGYVALELLTLSRNSSDPRDRFQPLTCFGCYALESGAGRIVAFTAKKTILATGGLGGIFLHHTNQPGTVGHGVAMAHRAGARLIDLEYVQFHPTTFQGGPAPHFLITEALRGEGAMLVDGRGRRFLDAVDPRGSLAPRDIVARAIARHLAKTGDPSVFLDLSALRPDFVQRRFPAISQHCRAQGLDLAHDPIPVVPAAHYSCGGVHADLAGRTNIRHLGAIGETACTGLHGANRLASTSLLENLVGARAAARADLAELPAGEFRIPAPKVWESPTQTADPLLLRQDLRLIQQTMWNYAGIIRSPRRLERARRILLELQEGIQGFYRDCRPVRELVELHNAVQSALLVVQAATLNPVSKGCHYLAADE